MTMRSALSALAIAASAVLLVGAVPANAAPVSHAVSVASVAPHAAAKTTTKKLTKHFTVSFATRTVKTHSLAKGVRKVVTTGKTGVRTKVWIVTYRGTKKVSTKLISNRITAKPRAQVVWVGLGKTSSCDPNYSGACVPIASDVDCAGGSGNGPAYVEGPVYVTGTDIYGLDSHGDGVGCES